MAKEQLSTLGTPGAATEQLPAAGAAAAQPLQLTASTEQVEVTPIGLTSAQMKTSNPDAVTVIQTEATKANNERLSALVSAFAGDAELLAKAISDPKMTVASVKAERYDALQAKVTSLEAENGKLKTTGVVGFAASDKPTGAVPANEGEAFEAVATDYWNKNEKVRAEFGGIFTDFRADFKNNRDDYK